MADPDPEVRAAAESFRPSARSVTIPACVVTAFLSVLGTYLARPSEPAECSAEIQRDVRALRDAFTEVQRDVRGLREAFGEERSRRITAEALLGERDRAQDERLARLER